MMDYKRIEQWRNKDGLSWIKLDITYMHAWMVHRGLKLHYSSIIINYTCEIWAKNVEPTNEWFKKGRMTNLKKEQSKWTNERINEWTNKRIDEWTNQLMKEWTNVRMNESPNKRINGCRTKLWRHSNYLTWIIANARVGPSGGLRVATVATIFGAVGPTHWAMNKQPWGTTKRKILTFSDYCVNIFRIVPKFEHASIFTELLCIIVFAKIRLPVTRHGGRLNQDQDCRTEKGQKLAGVHICK